MIQVLKDPSPRVMQGDVIRDVELVEEISEDDGFLKIVKVCFPLVVVLTQACDLEQHHSVSKTADTDSPGRNDKELLSLLVAPLYNIEHVYQGVHLSELGRTMLPINKNRSPGQNLRNNETPRYHHLAFPQEVAVVDSVIDFKHYFSVSCAHLGRKKAEGYVCSVAPLFRERISQRFADYLARIGLPGAG